MSIKYIPRRLMEGDQGGEQGGAGGGTPLDQGGAPAQGTQTAWYDSFKDPGVKEWLKSYNDAYPDPEAVATKALNLEKFLGAEKAGRGVVLPKADAKQEEWREFYKKVGGAPAEPDGYKLPETIKPEIATEMNADPMIAAFREHASKSGMPQMFFQDAVQWYADQMNQRMEQSVKDFSARSEKDMEELKAEWRGVEFDKNTELGRRAAEQFLPHENKDEFIDKMSRIEGALGTKETMKLWAAIGAALGEHSFESGEGGSHPTGMTPEAARVRIDSLKKDSGFTAKLMNNDADSKAEWDRLHKIAFGQ